MQAQLETELHRNKFYSTKKKLVSDLAVSRAARVASLKMEARQEAESLKDASTALRSLSWQIGGINSAVESRQDPASRQICTHQCRVLLGQYTLQTVQQTGHKPGL